MLLEVSGLLGMDGVPDPARLVDELGRRGWQVGINQERPAALREDARPGFWAESVAAGLVLARAARCGEGRGGGALVHDQTTSWGSAK